MVDAVPALPRLPAVRSAVQSVPDRQPSQQAAQTLRLVLSADAGGALLGRSEQGQIYQLPPTTGTSSRWQAGQTLLVQVVRTGPPLEVRVLGTAGDDDWMAARTDSLEETPALRPDQAAILRLQAASTDPMAHAAHWRLLALAALRQQALPEAGFALPAPGAQPAQGDPALLLRSLPWHGWPLTLWLEQRRWTGATPNRRARRRPSTRLCLGLNLQAWGQIGLVLDVLDTQVGLTLVATEAHAVSALRAQVGAVAARIARTGLRLMRCHVRHVPGFRLPTESAPATGLAEHELPLALFRAGAEALEPLRRAASLDGTGTA